MKGVIKDVSSIPSSDESYNLMVAKKRRIIQGGRQKNTIKTLRWNLIQTSAWYPFKVYIINNLNAWRAKFLPLFSAIPPNPLSPSDTKPLNYQRSS